MIKTLLACMAALAYVSGCAANDQITLERRLFLEVENAETCRDLTVHKEFEKNPFWQKNYNAALPDFSPQQEVFWIYSKMLALAESTALRSILEEYASIFGDSAPVSRWNADRGLLVGRILIEKPSNKEVTQELINDIEVCISESMKIHPSEAWELRGRLYQKSINPAAQSYAVFAFTKAAQLSNDSTSKLHALRLRENILGEGWSSCQERLADFYIKSSEGAEGSDADMRPRRPDDTNIDYSASYFSGSSLENMQKKFRNIPRCRSLSTESFLKPTNDEAQKLLSASLGQSEMASHESGEICDAYNLSVNFDPDEYRGGEGSAMMGWLSLFGKDSKEMYNNQKVNELILQLLSELRSALPENQRRKVEHHKILTPLAPTLFLREYECRIYAPYVFSSGGHFEIDNTPSIVVSSGVVRQAMLETANHLFEQHREYSDLNVEKIKRRFRLELAFVFAHEFAHAYVDEGRSFSIDESTLDCFAAKNVANAYGREATLGVFESIGGAISDGRVDLWRLWSQDTVKKMTERISLSKEWLGQAVENKSLKCGTSVSEVER